MHGRPSSTHSIKTVDDEDRENEGDLIMAADKATTKALHFFVEHTSGVVCVAMPGADLDRLRLPLMVESRSNEECMSTAFTITVDLREGTTTGISAADRAATIAALANPATQPDDLRRPGHIFPLRARSHGVLARPGHTEAAVDLAQLAGCAPAGVLCEIVNRVDGSMARTPDLLAFARDYNLHCVTIDALVRYRLAHEIVTVPASTAGSAAGPLCMQEFDALNGAWHVLAMWHQERPGPLHTMTQDLLQDVFGLPATGLVGGPREAAAAVAAHGGVVVYITPRRALPEHLLKACRGAPGGANRALQLAVARSVARGLGLDASTGQPADAACMQWWDAQEHGAA